MSDSRTKINWNKLGSLGPLAQAGLVSAIVILVWVLVAPVAYWTSGTSGLFAAAAGAALCWLGAEVALAASWLFGQTAAAVYGLVIGMLARTLVPLLSGVALHLLVPAMARAGMVYYLLITYMATLATETVLALARIPSHRTAEKTL